MEDERENPGAVCSYTRTAAHRASLLMAGNLGGMPPMRVTSRVSSSLGSARTGRPMKSANGWMNTLLAAAVHETMVCNPGSIRCGQPTEHRKVLDVTGEQPGVEGDSGSGDSEICRVDTPVTG